MWGDGNRGDASKADMPSDLGGEEIRKKFVSGNLKTVQT